MADYMDTATFNQLEQMMRQQAFQQQLQGMQNQYQQAGGGGVPSEEYAKALLKKKLMAQQGMNMGADASVQNIDMVGYDLNRPMMGSYGADQAAAMQRIQDPGMMKGTPMGASWGEGQQRIAAQSPMPQSPQPAPQPSWGRDDFEGQPQRRRWQGAPGNSAWGHQQGQGQQQGQQQHWGDPWRHPAFKNFQYHPQVKAGLDYLHSTINRVGQGFQKPPKKPMGQPSGYGTPAP